MYANEWERQKEDMRAIFKVTKKLIEGKWTQSELQTDWQERSVSPENRNPVSPRLQFESSFKVGSRDQSPFAQKSMKLDFAATSTSYFKIKERNETSHVFA